MFGVRTGSLTLQMNLSTSGKAQSPEEFGEEDVIFHEQMGNRTILLNRPKKLNSLNLSMIKKMLPRLKVQVWVNVLM
jgi:hypothetical protein